MKIAPVFLVVMLIFVEKEANAGYCSVRMVNGKMEKFGDCDNKQQSQVLGDLDRKLKKMRENEQKQKRDKAKPKSCSDVKISDAKVKNGSSGVFDIYPESIGKAVEVYCDLETEGGNWTVFQRRIDGSEDFYRNWSDYRNGFGKKDKEFWLGLENLHQMTKNGRYELRVELKAFDNDSAHATYKSFSIGPSAGNYTLNVGSYNGTVGDSLLGYALWFNNGKPFTTKDKDNDERDDVNCAVYRHGGWWHWDCGYANLNGQYHVNITGDYRFDGVYWLHWKGSESLKSTEMKFRRVE